MVSLADEGVGVRVAALGVLRGAGGQPPHKSTFAAAGVSCQTDQPSASAEHEMGMVVLPFAEMVLWQKETAFLGFNCECLYRGCGD